MTSLGPPCPLWLGPRFAAAGSEGGRLLILAEKYPDRSNGMVVGTGLDAELVANYVSGTLKHRQFTEVARLFYGEARPRSDCEKFWNSVALSNVLPRGARTNSRSEPSPDDWALGRSEVQRLLTELRPTALLVLGTRLAAQLKPIVDSETMPPSLDQHTAFVPHPGVPGFAFRDYAERVQSLRASL